MGDRKQLLANMQSDCGRTVRSSDDLQRLQNMLRNQALSSVSNLYLIQSDFVSLKFIHQGHRLLG